MKQTQIITSLSLLLLFVVFIVDFVHSEQDLIQSFTIHANERCDDTGETFKRNVRNLARVSKIVASKTVRCACADFGVWLYSSKVNYYGGEFGGSHLVVTKIESEKSCITIGQNQTILSVRKVGHSDVQDSAISFYVEYSLRGRELYFDGTFVQLPWPILFRSVGFTGLNSSWTLYPTIDESGPFTCMGQKENTLITYSSGSKLNLIGSVARGGCAYPSGEAVESLPPSPSLALNLRDRSKQLATDSRELRLAYPVTVYSYEFTGESNWTLYRGILFNGRSKCLYNTGDESGAQNFIDEVEGYPIASIIVGSIKRGCHHVSSIEHDEDYPTENDDIYDYEDGYGQAAAMTSGETFLTSSIGLVVLSILVIP